MVVTFFYVHGGTRRAQSKSNRRLIFLLVSQKCPSRGKKSHKLSLLSPFSATVSFLCFALSTSPAHSIMVRLPGPQKRRKYRSRLLSEAGIKSILNEKSLRNRGEGTARRQSLFFQRIFFYLQRGNNALLSEGGDRIGGKVAMPLKREMPVSFAVIVVVTFTLTSPSLGWSRGRGWGAGRGGWNWNAASSMRSQFPGGGGGGRTYYPERSAAVPPAEERPAAAAAAAAAAGGGGEADPSPGGTGEDGGEPNKAGANFHHRPSPAGNTIYFPWPGKSSFFSFRASKVRVRTISPRAVKICPGENSAGLNNRVESAMAGASPPDQQRQCSALKAQLYRCLNKAFPYASICIDKSVSQ